MVNQEALVPESSASASSAIGACIKLKKLWQPHSRDTCGAQNLFRLGATINFDRSAFSQLAESSSGGAR